jgi:hypothetical protein
VELLQLISEQTPAVALAITIWFFSNREILRFLQERREMIEALRQERLEWNEALRQITERYDNRQREATEAKMTVAAEMHALRGKLTEWIANDNRRGRSANSND